MKNILPIGILALVIFACNAKKEFAVTEIIDAKVQEKGVYRSDLLNLKLETYKKGSEIQKASGVEITLLMEKGPMQYSGKAACNRYFGGFEMINDSRVNFKPGGSTEMMCSQELMTWEVLYFNALMNHTYDIVEGEDEVIFKEVDGDIKLTWRKNEDFLIQE